MPGEARIPGDALTKAMKLASREEEDFFNTYSHLKQAEPL